GAEQVAFDLAQRPRPNVGAFLPIEILVDQRPQARRLVLALAGLVALRVLAERDLGERLLRGGACLREAHHGGVAELHAALAASAAILHNKTFVDSTSAAAKPQAEAREVVVENDMVALARGQREARDGLCGELQCGPPFGFGKHRGNIQPLPREHARNKRTGESARVTEGTQAL